MVDLAYHWSPASRRAGVRRYGLKPGCLDRTRVWRPPFVCFSRDPAYAIGSAHAYLEIAEPMDLWQIDLDALDYAYETFDMMHLEDGTPHDEIRVYRRIYKSDLTFIATRETYDG